MTYRSDHDAALVRIDALDDFEMQRKPWRGHPMTQWRVEGTR